MMHITVVNLLVHSFLPDPEHDDREKKKARKKKARVKCCPEVAQFPVTTLYLFDSLRIKKHVSQGIMTEVSEPLKSRA